MDLKDFHRLITRKLMPSSRDTGGYPDLRNPNMDTELSARLRARRAMMEKQQEDAENAARTKKAAKSSTSSHLKRPHQPDFVHPPVLQVNEDLANEVDRLKILCDSRTSDLQAIRQRLHDRTVGFDAMTTLVQYLTQELDAFSCPRLSAHLNEAKDQLTAAQQQLVDITQSKDAALRDISTLRSQQQSEIEKLRTSHQRELQSLEIRFQADAKLHIENAIQKKQIIIQNLEVDHTKTVLDMKLQHERALQTKEQEHVDQVKQLQQEENEKISELARSHEVQLEELTKRFENMKQCLSDRAERLRLDCDELRRRERNNAVVTQQDNDRKIESALMPYRYLEQEVESLRTVVDLRNRDLQELRQRNIEMTRQLEELPPARDTIIKLRQKIENLEAIINIKVDYERDLAEKHNGLLRKFDRESKAKKRLSMDNEELVWRLSMSLEAESTPDVFRQSSMYNGTGVASSKDLTSPNERRLQRPKSMVLLQTPRSAPPAGERLPPTPPQRMSVQPHVTSSGVKLRRPRMGSAGSGGGQTDLKLNTIRQSDV